MSRPDDTEDELPTILDAHATVYTRATMQYITDEITEEERDKEFHHSDLKTLHAIQANYISKNDIRAAIENNKFNDSWNVPSVYVDRLIECLNLEERTE